MPVWHEATAQWVKDGQLVLLGVTQEQHADRCRLLAQWKAFGWPILHDPINVMGTSGVPVLTAIDEHGIVRSTEPSPDTFGAEFLDRSFANDTPGTDSAHLTPLLPRGPKTPDWELMRAHAKKADTAAAWRELGDALALWGGEDRVGEAVDSYRRAAALDTKDGPSLFRLGVCYRLRYDSTRREPGDFQAAIDNWGKALDLDPNQYIWRRRIQQYGLRLDKPYPFYDWVEEAEKAIVARGEKPVKLAVRPGDAEIAHPVKSFPPKSVLAQAPDPEGKIHRDKDGLIRAEVTVVPGRVSAGKAVRVHIVLRPDPNKSAHWNNEAEPLRLWVEPPKGWRMLERLLKAPAGTAAVSEEARSLEFEIQAPADARGKIRISACALYHVCDDQGGQCRFLRLDVPIELMVGH